jgi:hypothetical protein
MSYDLYHDSKLNKDSLTKNDSFISDARVMLTERENYDLSDLETPEQVYDQFMEHFRYQNVNEVTALLDLEHVQGLDENGKQRFGRLMDTYDRMDSDLGLKAAQDYVGGVFTAPSTYAGMFSFGAGKTAALLGQQGIKMGIRQAIKSGGLRAAAGSAAVDAAGAGVTVGAQEGTRVEAGLKDEVDMTRVGLATAIGTVAGGVVGGVTGTKRAVSSNVGARMARLSTKKDDMRTAIAHKTVTKAVFEDDATKETAGTISDILIRRAEEKAAEEATKTGTKVKKASLRQTVGEQIEEGEAIIKSKGTAFDLTLEPAAKTIQNISAAAAKIDNLIPEIPNLPTDKIERLTSRFTRGLALVDDDALASILKEHNVSRRELMSVYPTVVSEAASIMGVQSGVARKLTKAEKAVTTRISYQLDQLDELILKQGLDPTEFTSPARKELDDRMGKSKLEYITSTWANMNKARIGFMTVQLTTTVRNTSNGFLRNYFYAMDNFGAGLVHLAKGSYGKLTNPTDAMAKAEAERATRMGVAMIKGNFASSVMAKDMVLGMESNSTNALFAYLRSKPAEERTITNKLLREMGDISGITGAEGGIVGVARKLNTLNTMSDNMFKRAIFAREVDKAIRAKPITVAKKVDSVRPDGVRITEVRDTYDTLDAVLRSGNMSEVDDKILSDAMKEAFEFTYQTGDFAMRKGGFNKAADMFINAASTSFGGIFAPFPRYMVNQFRFAYEHAPILGMVNLAGIKNKVPPKILKKNPDTLSPEELVDYNNALKEFKYTDSSAIIAADFSEEALGKQIGGLGMIATFMGLRYNFGDEKTGPYEYINPQSGGKVDARAAIGPFSVYAWIADLMYRYNVGGYRGEDVPVYDGKPFTTRPLVEALVGQQGRAGTGLDMVDTVVNLAIDMGDKEEDAIAFEKSAAKLLGNYLNTYTVGAGMFKDMLGTVDEDFRRLPDNADVDFLDYVFKQAVRSIPIPLSEDDKLLPSPTQSTPVQRFNPILKLVSGLTPIEPQSFVKDELDRLRFDYREISPTNIKGDVELSSDARRLMGEFVDREIASFIRSDDYKDSINDESKRNKLKTMVQRFRTRARNLVLDPNQATEDAEIKYLTKINFMNKSAAEKKLLRANYKSIHDTSLDDDERWDFSAK